MKILYLRFALVGLLFKGGFVSNMRIKILNLRFCAAGFLFKGGLVFCLYVHASSLWSTVFGLEEIMFQAKPNPAAEQCMRVFLKWLSGNLHFVQRMQVCFLPQC